MLSISKRMKIFCGVCILISIMLLFSTWIKCIIDLSKYQEEIIGGLQWLQMWVDNDTSIAINKIIQILLDGKLTAFEMLTACKNCIPLVGDVLEDNKILMFCVAYIVDFIIVIISGLWTEYKIFKGYITNGDKVFFISQLVLVAFTIIVVHNFSNLFDESIDLMSITASPFIAVLFALPISAKCKIPIDNVNINNGIDLVKNNVEKFQSDSLNNRTDSYTAIGNDNKICDDGEKIYRCKNCGSQIDEDSVFCEYCGAKIKNI